MAKGAKTGGRKKGVPNKLTGESRLVFKAMFDRLAPKAEGWIEDTASGGNPAKAAELTLRLAEFHIPRQAKNEVTGEDGGPLVVEIVKYTED